MGLEHLNCDCNAICVQETETKQNGVLPPVVGLNQTRKTLVLDLDGTLVHSSETPMPAGHHFIINLTAFQKQYYVLKRPGVDELLQQLGSTGLYEIVVFTAANKEYADAVVDGLLDSLPTTSDNSDIHNHRNIIPPTHRLSRSHCKKVEGVCGDVKDLSLLGRDLQKVIFVDDRPYSYHLHPEKAIPTNRSSKSLTSA